MPGSQTEKKNLSGSRARWRAPHSELTLAQRARKTLQPLRFPAGLRMGGIELSPQFSRPECQALAFWIRRIPGAFGTRLPKLKLAVAEQLRLIRTSLFLNDTPVIPPRTRSRSGTHAASFIPERYLVLHRRLFRRQGELGRILYHELCHFLWPRLGNPKRRTFEALLQREFREKISGELGYSAQWRKEALGVKRGGISPSSFRRRWREYLCESFCDTGSFVLLGRERRARHSEYTLNRPATERRARLWAEIILESSPGSRGLRGGN